MTRPLHILLLGHPQVTVDGQAVDIQRREVRALLYYLACQRAPVTRGKVISLLWPDTDEGSARKRLRETLARLRKNLPETVRLHSTDDRLLLDPDDTASDVRDFLAVVEEVARPLAQLPGAMPLPAPLYQTMSRGVNLWRAPAFLAEARLPNSVNWERWQRDMANLLETTYQNLLERLADHDAATGNFHQAITWLGKAMELDALDDNLHLRAVELYERTGKVSQGLSYLQQVRARYQEEGTPFPDTLSQAEGKLREGLTQPKVGLAGLWAGTWAAQLPFFGRRAELVRLQTACRRGGVTVVLGEPGSGKTRLMQELLLTLQPTLRLLAAFSNPLETNLPFQPLIDMLRSQVSADEWRTVPRTWLASMTLLLPELSVLFPNLEDVSGATTTTQAMIFEAFLQVLRQLNRSHRLLVFVDDVQWCDESSLHLLAYLAEHGFFSERAALVLACREDDQPPVLREMLARLEKRYPPELIALPPLDREGVAGMARYILGTEPSEPAIERFGRDTGGNPLFLLESLRALLEYPTDLRKNVDLAHLPIPGALPIPGSMHALIHERLSRLSAGARQALTIAAVIGSQVDLDVLEKAAGLPSDSLAQALEELETRRLLHPASGSGDAMGYQFVHDRIREIIYIELSQPRRRVYHLRVAQALREKYGPGDSTHAAVLAQHFEGAGEWQEAFRSWRQAAIYARKLLSLGEAESTARSAEKLLDRVKDNLPEEEIYLFYGDWIFFSANTGNTEDLLYASERLMRLGEHLRSPRCIALAYLGYLGVHDLRDEPEEGQVLLEKALPFIQQAGDAVLWLWYAYCQSGFLMLVNRYVDAINVLKEAVDRNAGSSAPMVQEALCDARYRLARAYLQNGWPARSLKEGEQLMEDGRTRLNSRASITGLMSVTEAEYFMGRYITSQEYAHMALGLVEPLKNPRTTGTARVNLSKVELTLGLLDSSFAHAQVALEIGLSAQLPRITSQAYRVMGDVMGVLDNFAKAEEYYRLGVETADLNYTMIDARLRLGWLLVTVGKVDEGDRIIDEVIGFCVEKELTLHLVPAQVAKAYALLAQGRLKEANALGRKAAALAIERDLRPVHAMAFTALAAIALHSGRTDEAAQKALVVIREAREIGNPLLEFRAISLALMALGPMHPSVGELHGRFMQLAGELAQNCQSETLHPFYLRFSEKITALQMR